MNSATNTKAKAMLLAMSMPGWDSLDAVRRIHSRLELAAIVLFGLLVLADILEHIAKNDIAKKRFEKTGLVFFAMAIVAEGCGYEYGQRNDELSEQVIGSLDSRATDAYKKAGYALTKSGAALENSELAIDEQKELDILRSPRRLIDANSLSTTLSKFPRNEYIINSSPDNESLDLTRSLNEALNKAGWSRSTDLIPNFPTATNVFGDGPKGDINLCIDRGIVVHMGGKGIDAKSINSAYKRDPKTVPLNTRAAISLASALGSHIKPEDPRNANKDVLLDPGKPSSVPITICIGQKPNTFVQRSASIAQQTEIK